MVRCNWSIDLGVAYLPVLCASGPRQMILVTGLGGITQRITHMYASSTFSWEKVKERETEKSDPK